MIDVILLFENGENRRKSNAFFVVMISGGGGVRMDGRVFIDLGLNNEIQSYVRKCKLT